MAADPSPEHWLKCIIKPSPYSQMTEEHEISPWRADMYFASTELPRFERLADVLEQLQASLAPGVGPLFLSSFTVLDVGVSWHFHLL